MSDPLSSPLVSPGTQAASTCPCHPTTLLGLARDEDGEFLICPRCVTGQAPSPYPEEPHSPLRRARVLAGAGTRTPLWPATLPPTTQHLIDRICEDRDGAAR